MSKKTKAEKHARRVAPKRRNGAHQRGRKNPIRPGDIALLSSDPQAFVMARGILRIMHGLEDLGIIDFGHLKTVGFPVASPQGCEEKPRDIAAELGPPCQ